MSCIPFSGGCERPATDAFVSHLNRLESKHYYHRSCLDQIDGARPQPQPECLYVDGHDGTELVIERKSILWPESYAYDHSKDHELANEISDGITGVEFPDFYTLAMPSLERCSKSNLTEMGRCVAAQIRARYPDLETKKSIRIECGGRRFIFKIRPMEDRDGEKPSGRLVIKQRTNSSLFDIDNLGGKLHGQIKKIYTACVGKFDGYSEARRILMLDPYGDVEYTSARSWNTVFALYPPPLAIQEIWIERHSSSEEEWVFEKAYGENFELPFLPTIPVDN